ncbi:MAG: MBL fold metallo-hydrolase [Bacillota bacterium]
MVRKIMVVVALLALIIVIAVFRNPLLRQPAQLPEVPPAVGKDEIKVIILGTGSPLNNPLRSKPSQVVLAGGKYFLVDCGGGTVSRLQEAGIPLEKIEDVFFTHQHSDHDSGFIDFFISSWDSPTGPRNKPLKVYGPPTTKEVIGVMRQSLDYDISVRQDHIPRSSEGLNIEYTEMSEGVIYNDGQVKVTVFPVEHSPVKDAVGYRFEYKGKLVVFSGDTGPCENIVKYGRDADLLVHEAYSKEWMEAARQKFPEKANLVDNVVKYHSSTLEVADEAQRAGVKHVVLTHLMPAPSPVWYWEQYFIKGMRGIYNGKISVGRDLMTFSLE